LGVLRREAWGAPLFAALGFGSLTLILLFGDVVPEISGAILLLFAFACILIFFVDPWLRRVLPVGRAGLVMLEVYIFLAHFAVIVNLPSFLAAPAASLQDPRALGLLLLYLLPLFSAAFTYGIRGSLLTWLGLLGLYVLSVWSVAGPTTDWALLAQGLIPAFIVLLVLAMMAGMMSEMKSRSEAELGDRLSRVTTLNRMQELLRDSIYYDNIWQHILTLASFIVPCARGAVVTWDGNGALRTRATLGEPPLSVTGKLPDGRPLADAVAGGIVIWQAARLRRSGRSAAAWRGTRALLAAPLHEGGTVTGALLLADPARRSFGVTERDLLAVVINQIQVALDNARLFREASLTAQRLQFILRSISSGVISCDLDGRVTSANAAALELLRYREEELLGKKLQEDVYLFRGEPLLLATLRQGAKASSTETVLTTKDHCELEVGISTWQLRDDAGGIIGATAVFKDIGELKRMQRELANREKLAAVGSLAAGVAHELRNPLGGVGGFASLLRREVLDRPAALTLVEKIMRGVTDVNRVLEQFLALTEERRLQYQVLNLHELTGQLTASLDGEARSRGVGWDLCGVAAGLMVKADPLMLRQMLQVLLRNALEASATGGTVTVAAAHDPVRREWQVTVTDHGAGIAPELRERIFQPFYTTKEHGTGMGLAVAQRHARALGGDLTVDSEPGRGSTFAERLPSA